MLDPNNDFNSPCYDDTFRRNFYFAEFNSYKEYFIELDYWIMREAFVSRIGNKLNLAQKYYDDGGDGEEIFRDIFSSEKELLERRNYFLADEIIDTSTSNFGDIYKVTEIYVYAPKTNEQSTIFKSWATEVTSFPQLVDYEYDKKWEYKYNGLTYLCGLDEVGIPIVISEEGISEPSLEVGDTFYIERPEFRNGRTIYYACRSSMLTVSRREGSKIWAKASMFTNPYTGNTWSAREIIFDYRNSDFGCIRVKQSTKIYPERSLQVSVRKETTFHTSKPDINERFFPKNNAGLEATQIDCGTIPTFIEYNQMVKNKAEIHPQPSNIEEVFKGLWKKEDFFCEAK